MKNMLAVLGNEMQVYDVNKKIQFIFYIAGMLITYVTLYILKNEEFNKIVAVTNP
jgi:hypothetical protein